MSWLTDVYGPRLTNSPGFRKAGEWAVKEMTLLGAANVKLEPWVTPTGPFGRGWSNDKFYMQATTPGGSFPIIGMSTAWTAGTERPRLGRRRHRDHRDARRPREVQGTAEGQVRPDLGDARRAGAVDAARRSATPTQQLAEMQRDTDTRARAADAPAARACRRTRACRWARRTRRGGARTSPRSGRSSSRTKASLGADHRRTAATAAPSSSAATPPTASRTSPTSACRRSSSRSSTTAASPARSRRTCR